MILLMDFVSKLSPISYNVKRLDKIYSYCFILSKFTSKNFIENYNFIVEVLE